MNDSRLIKVSKYLSKYLRHTPDEIGIKLAPGGWDCFSSRRSANASLAMTIGHFFTWSTLSAAGRSLF
jgi:RNA:NAD 2'-phosphotransferase (TPT1/KptA family)